MYNIFVLKGLDSHLKAQRDKYKMWWRARVSQLLCTIQCELDGSFAFQTVFDKAQKLFETAKELLSRS